MGSTSQRQILTPGQNCWRIVKTNRASFLIDGEAYFTTLKASLERASQFVFILAWDIDSRIRLLRNDDQASTALGDFLNALAKRKRGLHIYVLTWDFAMLYALEREWLPVYKFDWRTHRRVHFRMDGEHPAGASQHQKIVVVDDNTAFVGGFDLTRSRWDTPKHEPKDPRRVNPYGLTYPPFHDVQIIVEGEAAAALGVLARDRWYRATGRRIPAARETHSNCWPAGLQPDLKGVDVAIARTQPDYGDTSAVREVERSYLDAIAAARRYVYVESQYLTSNTIGDALARRLQEQSGPEIVVVLPRETAGWLEQVTMDVLRARLLERLRQADRHGRLKIYYPDIPGLVDECVCVHAKVMIVDDKLVRVGSSNLSNRSMSLDAECDVAIEAGGDKRIVSAIRRFRDRLLAEHLGVTPAEVANTVNGNESLIKGIEALRSSQRTLRDLDGRVPEFLERQIPESALIDPERPMDADRLIAELGISDERSQAHYSWLRLLVLVIGLIALAAAWRWTPMADQLDAGKIVSVLSNVRQSPMGPLLAVAAFVIGGLVVAPVTVLIVATALVFGPLLGFACSLVGTLLSAIVVYGIGRLMKRDTARWFSGSRLNRLSQRLARRGLVSIVAVRIIPVAPFTVVNLVAGVSHVSFRDFVLGTLVGMTPGLVAMVIFADRLHDALIEPNLITIALVLAVVVAIAVLAYFMRQWLTGNSVGDNSQRGHQR